MDKANLRIIKSVPASQETLIKGSKSAFRALAITALENELTNGVTVPY